MTDSEFHVLMRLHDRLRDLESEATNLMRDIRIAKEDAGVALHESNAKCVTAKLRRGLRQGEKMVPAIEKNREPE